jgi:hypothetical protein
MTLKPILTLLTVLLLASLAALHAADGLLRTETWTENWPNASGATETRTVTAEVWTQAFQADLDADGKLHIPARDEPYYLDGPIVMKSGQKLTADAKAEIRLKPGTNTCMVRNEHIIGFADKPVPAPRPTTPGESTSADSAKPATPPSTTCSPPAAPTSKNPP